MIFSLLTQPGAKIYLLKGNKDLEQGKFQFEYTITPPQFYYDLSNIDGAGGGKPGNYFDEENVTITPTGNLGTGNCLQVNCPPADFNTQCKNAYWNPWDDAAAMRVGSPNPSPPISLIPWNENANANVSSDLPFRHGRLLAGSLWICEAIPSRCQKDARQIPLVTVFARRMDRACREDDVFYGCLLSMAYL